MATTALYHWNLTGSPVQIFLELPAMERLRQAAVSAELEIGGLLLGHFEDGRTIVTGFELIESEHRRGAAFSLTHRDEARLQSRLESHARDKNGAVVGFFRSHFRPGMFLDEADYQVVSSYFHAPGQVVLLIKVSVGTAGKRSVSGGFFFWEDGEMNRKQTYRSFPMDSNEMANRGATPQPVSPNGGHADTFGDAETLDRSPATVVVRKRANWPVVAGAAAVAAFGGYLVGTSTHDDRFGSRAGDISFDPTPAPVKAAELASAPKPTPMPEAPAPETKPVGTPTKDDPTIPEQDNALPAYTKRMARVPPPPQTLRPIVPPPVNEPVVSAPPPQTTAVNPVPPLAPEVAPVSPPPIPRAVESFVYVESVQGGLRHAMTKFPFFGRKRDENFTPPQAVKSFAPKVPTGLAQGLTGTLPVDLRLKVDRAGKVTSVEIVSRGTDPEFVRLAGDAAYDWQFEPAHVRDRTVASEVIAHFKFRPQ